MVKTLKGPSGIAGKAFERTSYIKACVVHYFTKLREHIRKKPTIHYCGHCSAYRSLFPGEPPNCTCNRMTEIDPNKDFCSRPILKRSAK